MSNGNNDVVIIELDRPREIRFGHKAIKKMLALTGMTMETLNVESTDLVVIEKIMYCGLLNDATENGETLKLEDMEDLLDKAKRYNDIIEKMSQALENAFGVEDEPKNLEAVANKPKK